MTHRIVRESRPHCPAPLHDTRSARERQHCVCPAAALDAYRNRKRRYSGLPRPAPHVPVVGTTRRLQALAVVGWSSVALARELGIDPGRVRHLRRGHQPAVEASTAEIVAAAYPILVRRPAPPVGKDGWSWLGGAIRAGGWHAPAAWAGVDIDDPDAQPPIRLALRSVA